MPAIVCPLRGGGGRVINQPYSVSAGQTLTITVAGQSGYPAGYNYYGPDGGSSSISGGTGGTVTAAGGGGGRGRSSGGPGANTGYNGGGGSYDYGTGNVGVGGFWGGNACGGSACGGGAGANGPGNNCVSSTPGTGGNGLASTINGVRYGGGGGAGNYPGSNTAAGNNTISSRAWAVMCGRQRAYCRFVFWLGNTKCNFKY